MRDRKNIPGTNTSGFQGNERNLSISAMCSATEMLLENGIGWRMSGCHDGASKASMRLSWSLTSILMDLWDTVMQISKFCLNHVISVVCCLVTKNVENKISWNIKFRKQFQG